MSPFRGTRTSLMRRFALIAGVAITALHPEIGACVCPAPGKISNSIPILPDSPSDIVINGVPDAPCATLEQAAYFAWQEFIALNWPAQAKYNNNAPRDTPDKTLPFGDPSYKDPLVWHTFRGKVEIFPGPGNMSAYQMGAPDYGYDQRPLYSYDAGLVTSPSDGNKNYPTPWINLDENSQIGLNKIYAGVVSSTPEDPSAQILFTAKANRFEYRYITSNQWWNPPKSLFKTSASFVSTNKRDPYPGSTTCDGQSLGGPCISLPVNSIEAKAAWRKLTDAEARSGRFYTTTVRRYIRPDPTGLIQAVDETRGLIGLHIIQKTSSAPYFIYATFEQADNITDASGNAIEDEDGNYRELTTSNPMTPNIVSQNAGPGTTQKFDAPDSYPANPGKELYYRNINGISQHGLLDGGIVTVNRRVNDIPPEIINVNKIAHSSISTYAGQQKFQGAPVWMYYKLVNVQYVPIAGKVSGVDQYPRSTYYQANSVIETDYNLQKFSGEFDDFGKKIFTITDFTRTKDQFGDYKNLLNVAHKGGAVNMGGCMGCHGNAQAAGADFSFIFLDAPVHAPEWDTKSLNDSEFARFTKYMLHP